MRPSLSLKTRAFGAALLISLLVGAVNWRPARAEPIIHIVRPGENLFRIGLHYGVSWTAIMEANGLTSATIYVGQRLIIPVDDPALAPTSPTPAPVSAPAPAPLSAGTYVAQSGDTLFNIAFRYNLTVADLAGANRLDDPSLIYAGQTLTIPGADPVSNLSSPPIASTGGSNDILIDLSEQHLYAYEGNKLVYSFVVSTGEPGLETQPGSYSVLNKLPNAYASTWDLWMPNWLGIYWAGNLQNGIHALPYYSNGWRLWEGYLGTPISYGCVILGVNESQLLYDWAEVGTPVDIRW